VCGVRPEETSSSNFVTKELDGYLGENFVVTFHLERFRSIKTVKQQVRSSPFACQRGSAYLLHQILDQLVDLYMPMVEDFDDAINELEERIELLKGEIARAEQSAAEALGLGRGAPVTISSR